MALRETGKPSSGPAITCPSLLSRAASTVQPSGEQQTERSFARDLNLDQLVAAIAGQREERDLITRVLFGQLHDPDDVRYRQEVFQDLEDPALFGEIGRASCRERV